MYDSPSKHPLEVSKAVEFEEIKKLPKFSHSHMAVINPVHTSPSRHNQNVDSRIGVTGSPVKYQIKELYQKILPDHLIRPPPEILKSHLPKEKSIEDIIRLKESKEGRKLTGKEIREIQDKERKKEEIKERKNKLKNNSKLFFKECQIKLEEVNAKKETKEESKVAKSIIGALFSIKLKGMRKLYNDLMGTKPEKISKNKFLEFSKDILKGEKLTDTELKELYNFYCTKNKKKDLEPGTTKAKMAKVRFKEGVGVF